MTVSRYRAWRFVHPDFDYDETETGLQIGPSGGIEMVEEQESIRQAILLLLSTRPGERVMLPEYGCDLHRLIFSPNDDTTAGLAMHYVTRALERWEPRLEIVHGRRAASGAPEPCIGITAPVFSPARFPFAIAGSVR
jgi:phage baseplate assembly protein W